MHWEEALLELENQPDLDLTLLAFLPQHIRCSSSANHANEGLQRRLQLAFH